VWRKDGQVDTRFLPKIIRRPLLQHGAEGLSWQTLHSWGEPNEKEGPPEPTIEIDSRLEGCRRLDTEIHEVLHLACPWMPEYAVRRTATYLAKVLWHIGYRLKQ